MKKLLQGCLFFSILSLTACSKENLTLNSSTENGAPSSQLAKAVSNGQFSSDDFFPGFDEEVFDVPLIIKSVVAKNIVGTLQMKDSVYHFFNGDYSNSIVAGEDITDVAPSRGGENIAVARNGGLYSQEGRMIVASGYSDTIQLYNTFKANTAYKVRFEPMNFPSGFSIRVTDSHFNTSTNIALSGVTQLHIFITDPALFATDRFKLIIQRY